MRFFVALAIWTAIHVFVFGLLRCVWRWRRSIVTTPAAGKPPAIAAEPTGELHYLHLVRGEERYIVLYAPGHEAAARQKLGEWAANSELAFDWADAGRLAMAINANDELARTLQNADLSADVPGDETVFEPHPGLGILPSGFPFDGYGGM